jgi:pimeloyl-ACP methyl ester carboxylesterase
VDAERRTHLASSIGDGPPLVLVHGVGIGPESFSHMAERLGCLGWTVHTVARGGGPLEDQVDAIGAIIASLDAGPAMWVGVSGGATLGVLATIRIPDALAGVVLHEPLIGPLAPGLHERIGAAAAAMATSSGDAPAIAYVRSLVGDATFERLDDTARTLLAQRASEVRREVPHFATFAPSVEQLAACRIPVVVTVGEHSSAVRHDAAVVASDAMHGTVAVVPGVGHLPQVDDPDGYAHLVASHLVGTA